MSFLREGKTSKETFCQNVKVSVNTQDELSKLFKPITDMQKELKESLVGEINAIRAGMSHNFPQFLSITAYHDDGEKNGKQS